MRSRRSFLAATAGAAGCLLPTAALSQSSRPVRLIVPFAAGGPADVAARLAGMELQSILGQPIVVENLPGAGGFVGAEVVARAPADGNTLLLGSSSSTVLAPLLQRNRPNPAEALKPVHLFARMPLVMVTQPSGPATLAALIDRLRREPDQHFYASAGIGSISQLAGALLLKETQSRANHVPYRGSAPALQSVLAGETLFFLDALSGVRQHVRAGTLRGLAVTAERRSAFLPDVPTTTEQDAAGVQAEAWYGLLVHGGTDPARLAQLEAASARAARTLAAAARVQEAGFEMSPDGTGATFAALIETERGRWTPLIEALGITIDP